MTFNFLYGLWEALTRTSSDVFCSLELAMGIFISYIYCQIKPETFQIMAR